MSDDFKDHPAGDNQSRADSVAQALADVHGDAPTATPAAESTEMIVPDAVQQAGVTVAGMEHQEAASDLTGTEAKVTGELATVSNTHTLKVSTAEQRVTPTHSGIFGQIAESIAQLRLNVRDFFKELNEDKFGDHRFKKQYEVDISKFKGVQADLAHDKGTVVELHPEERQTA